MRISGLISEAVMDVDMRKVLHPCPSLIDVLMGIEAELTLFDFAPKREDPQI
jgi:hypothetical protein